jgi:F-type H+-transporting ATPase subunit epsilon
MTTLQLAHLQLDIVTPQKLQLSTPVAMVVVPGEEGDMGVLPNHAPVLSTLRAGEIHVYADSADQITERFFVRSGFVEITADRCTVLAEQAINLKFADKAAIRSDIDTLHARIAKAHAKGEAEEASKLIQQEIDDLELLYGKVA